MPPSVPARLSERAQDETRERRKRQVLCFGPCTPVFHRARMSWRSYHASLPIHGPSPQRRHGLISFGKEEEERKPCGRRACYVRGRRSWLGPPQGLRKARRYRAGPVLQGGRQPGQLAPRCPLASRRCIQNRPVRLRTGHSFPPFRRNLFLLGMATRRIGSRSTVLRTQPDVWGQ